MKANNEKQKVNSQYGIKHFENTLKVLEKARDGYLGELDWHTRQLNKKYGNKIRSITDYEHELKEKLEFNKGRIEYTKQRINALKDTNPKESTRKLYIKCEIQFNPLSTKKNKRLMDEFLSCKEYYYKIEKHLKLHEIRFLMAIILEKHPTKRQIVTFINQINAAEYAFSKEPSISSNI